MAESKPTDQVSAIMSTKVITIRSTDPVSKALRTMVKHKIGSIIAVEKGKPVGILTERDISIKVAKTQTVKGLLVKKTMSRPLVTVVPSMDIWDAVEQMVRKDIRRLPVMKGDKLVGMITERDVLRWLLRTAYEPHIPQDLKDLLESRAHAHSLVG